MKRNALLKRIRVNAIGTGICSIGTTLAQVIILYLTGGIVIHDFNAQVWRIIVALYLGSFIGLFSILHINSTSK